MTEADTNKDDFNIHEMIFTHCPGLIKENIESIFKSIEADDSINKNLGLVMVIRFKDPGKQELNCGKLLFILSCNSFKLFLLLPISEMYQTISILRQLYSSSVSNHSLHKPIRLA